MLVRVLEIERSQLDTKKLVVQKGESIQRNLLRIDRDTVVVGERCQEGRSQPTSATLLECRRSGH